MRNSRKGGRGGEADSPVALSHPDSLAPITKVKTGLLKYVTFQG